MLGPIPAHMDLVTGVHSLLANSLMSLCWLTACAGSCLVCPGALPTSVMKDGCFTLVMPDCTRQRAKLRGTAGEMVMG